MQVDSSLLRSASVRIRPGTGDGNAEWFLWCRLLLDPPRNFPAIHFRQTDLQQHHVRWVQLSQAKSGWAIAGYMNVVPVSREKLCHELGVGSVAFGQKYL
jgi:hypothetical protein